MSTPEHARARRPLHPLVAALALTLLAAALVCDLAGGSVPGSAWYDAGKYLSGAGIGLAIGAAAAALADRARTPWAGRARRHVLLDLAAVLAGGLAWWLRGAAGVPPDRPILVLEALAAALLLWSALVGRRARRGAPSAPADAAL